MVELNIRENSNGKKQITLASKNNTSNKLKVMSDKEIIDIKKNINNKKVENNKKFQKKNTRAGSKMFSPRGDAAADTTINGADNSYNKKKNQKKTIQQKFNVQKGQTINGILEPHFVISWIFEKKK